MKPALALLVSAVCTCAGVAVGVTPKYNAAVPATCGVAIDVPLIVLVPPLSQSDVTSTPGALILTHEPKFEK
jgi:hypothetical protein